MAMHEIFQRRVETAMFQYPGKNELKGCTVEYRIDPLTGRTSVICEDLLQKMSILYGETDADFVRSIADQSRSKCVFCPPVVFQSTPLYPRSLCPEGRLQNDTAILFPNLFPTAAIHAVLSWPNHHFLTPGQFSPKLLVDAFLLTEMFVGSIKSSLPDIRFISLNCNYMPPAGGSIIHPHFQIIGSGEPPHRLAETILAAEKWHFTNHDNFWEALVEAERNLGDRWIGSTGPWSWIAPWSPMGANEIMGIHESASSVFDLHSDDWSPLAAGLQHVLGYYGSQGYSSFNFCLAGSTRDSNDSHRCVIRIISRQNVRPNYRNDEYFLQKFHGVELIVQAPETLAAEIRNHIDQ